MPIINMTSEQAIAHRAVTRENKERFQAFSNWCDQYGLHSLIQRHRSKYVCIKSGHRFEMALEEIQWKECPYCSGEFKQWGAFYLVLNPVTSIIKLGISTGLAKNRLADHRASGFTCVLRLLTCEQVGDAQILETDVLNMLSAKKLSPAWGREYFALNALAPILRMIDSDDITGKRGFTSAL